MKLLLQGCCADCCLRFLEAVKKEKKGVEVVVYFYNPNIHPRSEYQSRLKAIKQVLEERKVKLVVPDWRPKEYFEVAKNDQKRCNNCWKLRINRTADWAKSNGFEQFSTTLLSSQYQNQKEIINIGEKAEKRWGVKFWVPKKKIPKLKTSGFYKQFFCGCVYSLKERFEEKFR